MLCLASASALASSGGAGLGGKAHHHRQRARHATTGGGNPLAGRGMWIWYLSQSNGGSVGSIISRAHRNGVTTLLIKSGDGPGYWSQFSRRLISRLHAAGFKVCGWQFVYGDSPLAEAGTAAQAARNGADCLMIDAEGQYEGKYVQAQRYMRRLRSLVGSRYPLALAGFPYIDYHPAFPYSVFLGPGGAQYNAPQMYWRDIGTSVDGVYAHTFAYNLIYRRPIFPLGEALADAPASNPPPHEIRRFRQVSRAYRSSGLSWWVWQGLGGSAWHALSQDVRPLTGFTPYLTPATVGKGAQGDLVVWAQEHLVSAGQRIAIDGAFGPNTAAAVRRFQAANGLQRTGAVGPLTWHALLRYAAAHVTWTKRGAHLSARDAQAPGNNALLPVPTSASLPAKRNEIPPRLGAGAPQRR